MAGGVRGGVRRLIGVHGQTVGLAASWARVDRVRLHRPAAAMAPDREWLCMLCLQESVGLRWPMTVEATAEHQQRWELCQKPGLKFNGKPYWCDVSQKHMLEVMVCRDCHRKAQQGGDDGDGGSQGGSQPAAATEAVAARLAQKMGVGLGVEQVDIAKWEESAILGLELEKQKEEQPDDDELALAIQRSLQDQQPAPPGDDERPPSDDDDHELARRTWLAIQESLQD